MGGGGGGVGKGVKKVGAFLIFSDLHFSVRKCHCRTYDENIGPQLKKPSFAILGQIICLTISSTSVGPRFVQI